jgi:soluble lytic murein transglycosylase
VPTLSEKQKDWLLTHPANEKLPDDIEKVAVAHAKQRLKDGLSVFHDTPEPVTSGKGAVGAAQVMRDTGPEAAALAGLPWDENKWKYDPAYNTAIGKAYFQKQLQNNNGDLGKAYAAYNAGPGALKAAVDKGGDNWLAMLPSETQAYVTNNLSAFNAGEGKPTQPTKQDVVYAAINALPKNSSPEVIKQTMANTEHLVELQTQATKQNEESVVAQMYTELSKNGGDLNAIPQSLRDQIPGEKLNAIQNFAESQGKGREHSDLAVYNHLVENPNYLLRLTPDQFVAYRNDLSESDWHSLQKQRESLRNPAGADSPDNLDTQAVNSVTNNLLSQLNIDATPKDTDEAGKARLGTIRKYINDSLLSQQAQTGKKFKEAEINKYITGLFAKDVQFKKSFLGFNYGTENKQLLLTKADEIPSDTRDSIKAAFKKNGVDDPTDGQILGSYFNGMSK